MTCGGNWGRWRGRRSAIATASGKRRRRTRMPDIDALPYYEGPLDLLLDLVRRQQVPIAELPLARITAQFFDYRRRAELLDINLGIDFAHTAAILIQLKSQALLPPDPEASGRSVDLQADLISLL